MMKYISRGEWFDLGTEARLLDDYRVGTPSWNCGLFEGYRNGHPDEEICGFDEFDLVEDEESERK